MNQTSLSIAEYRHRLENLRTERCSPAFNIQYLEDQTSAAIQRLNILDQEREQLGRRIIDLRQQIEDLKLAV